MINIITALNNEKINKELSKEKGLNVLARDIPYREGILEILEKMHHVQYIIINENIYGQIKIEKLIAQIKNKIPKINIIIILNKKEILKEKYLLENKIKYLYLENLTSSKILDTIFSRNKVIAITGNEGSGKTITTLILSQILAENKKTLIIEDNIKNNSIIQFYKKNKKEQLIKLKNNLFLFNLQKIMINHRKNIPQIINEINKIKNDFQYIFIDTQNMFSLKMYEEIINEIILIFTPNLLEINKIKNIINSKFNFKIILNNYNEHAISENIIKNIFHNKAEILAKIEYNKNYNFMINHHFNIQYLDLKTKRKYFNMIKKI